MSLWDYAENSKAEDSFIKRMSFDDTDHRSTCFIRFDPLGIGLEKDQITMGTQLCYP